MSLLKPHFYRRKHHCILSLLFEHVIHNSGIFIKLTNRQWLQDTGFQYLGICIRQIIRRSIEAKMMEEQKGVTFYVLAHCYMIKHHHNTRQVLYNTWVYIHHRLHWRRERARECGCRQGHSPSTFFDWRGQHYLFASFYESHFFTHTQTFYCT